MANPNIVNVSSIYGKTIATSVTTTLTALVSNSASSNKVFKINSILVSNIDGSSAADITVSYGVSGSQIPIASTITVPNDSTLVVLSKDTAIYLEEGNSIWASASANGDLVITISYEEIS